MARLAGLTGLNASSDQIQYDDAGVLEAHGGPVDESHGGGDPGGLNYPAAYGTGWKADPYFPDYELLGENVSSAPLADGVPVDRTPNSHRAPYPRGIIQTDNDLESYQRFAVDRQIQRKELHGKDLGGPKKFNHLDPAGREVESHYTTDRYDAPNTNILSDNVPGQIRGTGAGLKGTDQGFGALNDNPEFQTGHSIRRVQHDTLHWDRSLSPNAVAPQVFRGKFPVREAAFDTDSPYEQMGDTSTGQQVMERRGYPTPPLPPSQPVVIPSSSDGSADVWAY